MSRANVFAFPWGTILAVPLQNDKAEPEPLDVGSIVTVEAFSSEKFAVGKVSRGGMGIVYQLVPVRPTLGVMALKTYQNPADVAKFEHEARLWISLGTHAHIAHALWFGAWHNQPAILADWYPSTLTEANVRQWATDRILSLTVQLIDGLEFAFERVHLIHQDIKPSNVLVDDSGSVRIADFGVALLAKPLPQEIEKGSDTYRIMRTTVSSGSVAGTPIYMAPELFSGGKPSVQTDIFSLGVTLYEVLTGEHPYFDFEKGGFSSVLRKNPLSRVLRERGREIHAVVSLISSALELNLAKRPRSYSELLRGSGLRASKQQGQPQGPEDVVAQVALYRNQGRFDIAMRLLDGALESVPTDALLLNARGCLLIVLKDSDRAIEVLSSAMSVLETDYGRYKGQVYPDPAVNLSRQLLLKQNFSGADNVLARSWEWIRRDASFFSNHYTEFGWWFLYRGQFRQCCEHLQQTFRFKAPDPESLRWMTLAAVLGNELSSWATEIGRYYLQLPIDVGSALCIALIADAVPSEIAGAILQRANEEAGAALSQIMEELGLANRELQSPLSARAKGLIVRSLDYSVTGGKHDGIFR